MKKISFNQGTLGFDQNQAHFELPRSLIYFHSAEEVQRIHELQQIAFSCTVELKEEQLEMFFEIEEGYHPLLTIRQEPSDTKLNASEYLIKLGYFFDRQVEFNTVFDPFNFFVNHNGEIKILYRGIKGLMPAESYESEPILDQVKRLLLLLFTSARYDELRIHGLPFARSKTKAGEKRIVHRILQAENYSELLNVVQKEREKRQSEEGEEKREQVTSGLKASITLPSFLSSWSGKRLIVVGSVAWIFSLIVAFVIGTHLAPTPSAPVEESPEFLHGLRQASLQEFQEAAKSFKKLDFKRLSKTDQRIVLLAYLFSGQPQTALSLEPSFVEDVANYYGLVDKKDELLKIKSNHPAIRFEQAYAKENYQAVIQLQNQVTLDRRRRKAIVTAYLKQGQVDQAKQFANRFKDPELTKLINETNK